MKYAVLLRGVNIGGRKVKSQELKDCFTKAGFSNPQTVLATGNVVISSKKSPEQLKVQIETSLLAAFNFPIEVLVIGCDKLARIVKHYPFNNVGPEFHRYIIFKDAPSEPPDMELERELEAVQSGDEVLYWRVLKGHTLDSDFAKQSARTARARFSTTRNMNTLEKILAKA